MVVSWRVFAVAVLSCPGLCALDSVSVELDGPEDFTDFTITDTGSKRELAELSAEWIAFIEAEAALHLSGGGALRLVFTDIDMAGDFEPWRAANNPEIRYFRSMYRPRLEFSYRLIDAGGEEIRSGEETLRDVNFELGRSPGYESELLYYEKSLLRGWLMRFGQETSPSGEEEG